jgi:hypothetical protein
MGESPDAHRVLVVDDEPDIVDVVAMGLRFQGFAIESAATGAEALAKVARADLLVLGSLLATPTRFVALKTWVFARGQRPRRPSTDSARSASSTAAAAAGVSGRRSSSTASSAEYASRSSRDGTSGRITSSASAELIAGR